MQFWRKNTFPKDFDKKCRKMFSALFAKIFRENYSLLQKCIVLIKQYFLLEICKENLQNPLENLHKFHQSNPNPEFKKSCR